jgi:hypothetical protein
MTDGKGSRIGTRSRYFLTTPNGHNATPISNLQAVADPRKSHAMLTQVNDSIGNAVMNARYLKFVATEDTRDPHPDRIFPICWQHCSVADIANKCPISRSRSTRSRAVGTDDGAAPLYRANTELHGSGTWRARRAYVSAWTASLASVQS